MKFWYNFVNDNWYIFVLDKDAKQGDCTKAVKKTCLWNNKCPECLEKRRDIFQKLEKVCSIIVNGKLENDATLQQLLQDRTRIMAERMKRQDSGKGGNILLYKYLKEQDWPRHFCVNESGEVAHFYFFLFWPLDIAYI